MNNEQVPRKSFRERAKEIGDAGRGTNAELVRGLQYNVVNFVLRKMSETKIQKRELAERIGVKESQISRILHTNGNFTFDTISKLYKAFGRRPKIIDVDLFERRDTATPVNQAPQKELNAFIARTVETLAQSGKPSASTYTEVHHETGCT